MKKSFLILVMLISVGFQFCKKQQNLQKVDLELYSMQKVLITDSTVINFIDDFVNLPENSHRKVFTIFFDQNGDTLALTMFRYLYKKISLKNVVGNFPYKSRIILLYTPFSDLLRIKNDDKVTEEINLIYKDELEYYKNHKHELAMWQLRYSYHQKTYRIIKDYNRIRFINKPVIPDSVKIDIQWPAD